MPETPEIRSQEIRTSRGWHLVGGSLVAFWLTVMGLMFLAPDDLDAIVLSGGDLSAGFSVGEEWMGAYLEGRKLGYVHSTTRREGDRLHLAQQSLLEIEAGGVRHQVGTGLRVSLGKNFTLIGFEFDLQTGILDVRMTGKMEGSRLVVEVASRDETSRKTWAIEEPPVFDLAVPKMLAQHDLRAGQRFRVTLFDPRTLSNQPSTISVVGREAVSINGVLVPAVRLRRTAAGVSTDTWISEQGEVLKQENEIGLVLRREDKKRAVSRPKAGVPANGLVRKLLPGQALPKGSGEKMEEGGP